MNRFVRAPLAALLLSFATPALAQTAAPEISNAWSRATAPGQPNGAVYLTISVSAADQLIGASTPIADSAEAHETVETGGVMQMRPVAALALTPGAPASFAPGGMHIMLMGLHQPLQPGDSFALTLRFRDAAPVTTMVAVGRAGASAAPTGMPNAMPGMSHHDMTP